MILGGAIAVYLGIEELKQADNSETDIEPPEIQPNKIIEEKAGKSQKKKSEPVLDMQRYKTSTRNRSKKTEEKSTNTPDEQPDEQPESPDEQPEPEIQEESANASNVEPEQAC